MGIVDLIADDKEEYVELALRVGTDPEYRRAMHERILAAKDVLWGDQGPEIRRLNRLD